MEFCGCFLVFFVDLLIISVLANDSEHSNKATDHCDANDIDCNKQKSTLLEFSGDSESAGHYHSLFGGRHPERIVIADFEGVYVSVKTTIKYHDTRLPLIVLTWMQTIEPGQVHIVTDIGEDNSSVLELAKRMGFHVTHSHCPTDHLRQSLCCKSGVEFDQFYLTQEQRVSQYKWFCHFDDDVYVNVQKLVAALEKFNPTEERIYLGRWPLHDGTDKEVHLLPIFLKEFPKHKRTTYRYATGAAYCISGRLMKEVEVYLRGKSLEGNCEKLKTPDDMIVGTIIGAVLGYELTNELSINTHLNFLKRIAPSKLQEQITISYGEFKFVGKPIFKNVVNIAHTQSFSFTEEEDHTRQVGAMVKRLETNFSPGEYVRVSSSIRFEEEGWEEPMAVTGC